MIEHALEVKRCGLWIPMGMGKTSSVLTALSYLSLAVALPTLVVAPLRVAQFTWPDEVKKWDHLAHMEVQPVVGDVGQRTRALRNTNAGVFTTNYESLPWLVETLGDKWPFATVVADESTKLKGFRTRQGTQRAKALGKVAHTRVDRFIELTGTPSPNGLADLWGQAWFLDAGQRLGRSYTAFENRWFKKGFDGFSVQPLPHAQGEIEGALGDLCLSLDARDWFDLKEPIKAVVPVELPTRARAQYQDMEKKMFAEIAGNEVEAFGAAAKSNKCLQIASGAVYTDDERSWSEVHDAKLQALASVIEEAAGAPVLVAYHFRPDLERIMKAFPHAIDLATDEGLRKAKRGEGRIWLAHPASLGHGVDGLQDHCNRLAFFTVDWNLENHLQIIERIGPTRQMQAGLDRPVYLYYLVAADTVDETVLERQESKREVQDLLLEAMKRKGLG